MWPLSSPYPERRPEDVDGKTFDYIIVGGGTAGCVLASRLSEDPSVSVLVLEKGRVGDTFYTRIPLLGQNTDFPWMQAVTRLSEPVAALGGRRLKLPAGESLGGTTRVNGMIVTRGSPGGYNDWARSFGLDDWGWDDVEPYFRRSENAVAHPGAAHRGHGGPLEIRQFEPWFGSCRFYEKAALEVGLPVGNDANDPDGPAQGLFYLDHAVGADSTRMSAYRAWLNAAIANERKDRLSVCTGVIASRLEIDQSGKVVAGVHIRSARSSGPPDREYFVKARREVIICSGAVCTPQLLMLSGIGPKDQLKSKGIPLVHELPAVGRDLTDHYAVPIMQELPRKDTLHSIETAWGILYCLFLYFVLGKGPLATSSTPASIFFRTTALDDQSMTVQQQSVANGGGSSTMDSREPRNVPDVEIMLIPCRTIPSTLPGQTCSSLLVTLLEPFSRGSIELKSADPREHPRINYQVFSDERDRIAARKAVRFAMHLAEEFVKSAYPHPAPLNFAPGMDLKYLDSLLPKFDSGLEAQDEATTVVDLKAPEEATVLVPFWKVSRKDEAAVKANEARLAKANWRTMPDGEIDVYLTRVCTSSLHLASSCRMSLTPEDGVVDQRLKVHGLANLRIADASVFPKIPSGHIMAPTFMVAERCADFLKTEWAERNGK
ncbi:hypothetical protein GE09DRAFT_504995 [Coniochaeta sp. 2T2.1]|nr:hypothetical protein GE09DRAFT_504995 [Coniochaeta sp. 2T2.1]